MPGPARPVFLLAVLAALPATFADAPIIPLTVCEIVDGLPMYDGKPVAVLGRYSFRDKGRWLSEQSCASPPPADPTLWLVEDTKDGPHPPGNFELDGSAVERKLAEVRKRTALARFRFGSSDYDRWALVYGRVETRKGDAAKLAPADLVFRGDGVVVFLNE
jgi:hypothetical protein